MGFPGLRPVGGIVGSELLAVTVLVLHNILQMSNVIPRTHHNVHVHRMSVQGLAAVGS